MSIVISESQGLLAGKKHEGRCSGDYVFFTECEVHLSGFIKALDLKRILHTLKRNYVGQIMC